MTRLLLLFTLAMSLLSIPYARAADMPAPETVSFPSGKDTVHALLFPAAGPGKHPGIVVIHEWWGLNDWIKSQAAELAAHGYDALAVDLYRGHVATDPDTAHQLARGLPEDQGVRDLVAAANYLASRKGVEDDRIGAVGWCMGGGYALQLAIADPHLRAVSINYGTLATDEAALRKIHAAILGNFGAQDKGISPASVQAFTATLKSLGKSANVKEYPDAGHAFENPNNATGYRPADAQDAKTRTLDFFANTLGGRP